MATDTEPATVLVVEDEEPLADLYTRFLEGTYTVLTATRGAEAIELMSQDVDVVFLDRRMPGISGEEVLREIREDGYDCRVAMVTAVTPDVDIIEMGFDDYLTKPIDKTEMLETAERLLEVNSHDDLLQEYYQLTAKKATLVVERTDTSLSNSAEFRRLRNRLDEIESELLSMDGESIESRFRGERITDSDGNVIGIAGADRDDFEREENERALEELSESARQLMHADTADEVYDQTIDAATEILELSGVMVYAFDSAENALEPAAYSSDVTALIGEPPTFRPGGSIAWDAFVDQEPVHYANIRDQDAAYDPNLPLRSAIFVPLDDHGVLIAVHTRPKVYSESDFERARILGTNVEAALGRIQHEATIREQDRTLDRKNESLSHLKHLNSVIRDTLRTVASASTRTEIERAVCDHLSSAEYYRGVWIGAYDAVTESVEPTAWAGIEESYFDRPADDQTLYAHHDELVHRAIETGDVRVRRDILSTAPRQSHRKEALAAGFQSIAAAPLPTPDLSCGVLVVYGTQPDGFTDGETTVLAETGEVLGQAIYEHERTQALLNDGVIELELAIDDRRFVLTRLAIEAGGEVTLRGIASRDDSLALFVTLSQGDPDAMAEIASSMPSIETVSMVAEQDEGHLFRLVTTDTILPDHLRERGGSLRVSTATADGARVVLAIPCGMDVRSFVEGIGERYSGAELLARRQTTRDDQSPASVQQNLTDSLTARQYEALQFASHSGYFESPRRTNGDALAEAMGISPPTFHSHLRAAQQKLARLLFEQGDSTR